MESGPGALPGFKCWRAAANSRRHSQDVMDQPYKGQTFPVKQAEMSADSHRDERRFTPEKQ